MIIPKKLKIGGHTYKVLESKELQGRELMGECDTQKNTITIDVDLVQTQKEATLIHEIFHALNATYDDGINHALLDSLSEQFYQVLKDNKLLV